MKDINDPQVRHEMLIDFLGQFTQYQIDGKTRLKKVKKTLHSGQVEKINSNDINMAVVLVTDILNIGGGSIGDIDLYRLLQDYFLNLKKRELMNNIVRSR